MSPSDRSLLTGVFPQELVFQRQTRWLNTFREMQRFSNCFDTAPIVHCIDYNVWNLVEYLYCLREVAFLYYISTLKAVNVQLKGGVNISFQGLTYQLWSLFIHQFFFLAIPVMAPLQNNSHTQFVPMGDKIVAHFIFHRYPIQYLHQCHSW